MDSVQIFSAETLQVLTELKPSILDVKKDRPFLFYPVPGDNWDVVRFSPGPVLKHLNLMTNTVLERDLKLLSSHDSYSGDFDHFWDFSLFRKRGMFCVQKEETIEVWHMGQQQLLASVPIPSHLRSRIGSTKLSKYGTAVLVSYEREVLFTDISAETLSIKHIDESIRSEAELWRESWTDFVHPCYPNVHGNFSVKDPKRFIYWRGSKEDEANEILVPKCVTVCLLCLANKHGRLRERSSCPDPVALYLTESGVLLCNHGHWPAYKTTLWFSKYY